MYIRRTLNRLTTKTVDTGCHQLEWIGIYETSRLMWDREKWRKYVALYIMSLEDST